MPTPRVRMVISAAVLLGERGAGGTTFAHVLAHSGAPRGSAYHYFPDGRVQLLSEAVEYAGDHVAGRIAATPSSRGALDALVAGYRRMLVATDYRAGCPVVAVAVEAGDPESQDRAPLRERAALAFTKWNELIAEHLIAEGESPERAEELAMLVTAGIEGAIVVSRAQRDVRPLDLVHSQLRALLPAAEQQPRIRERTSDE